MKIYATIDAYAQKRPILIGSFAVLVTIVVGMGFAFATGFVTPTQVLAQVVPPCDCAPPPVIIPPPVVITPPVVVPPAVPTCVLKASPTTLPTGGGSVTLTWTSVAATSGSIDHGAPAPTPIDSGSEPVSVTSDTTYTLTVNGPGGSTDCSVTIKVTPPPPPVTNPPPTCTLTIAPTSITKGASATLTWSSTNAASVSLQDTNTGTYLSGVYASGSASVSPTATTKYVFTATGPGGSVVCNTTITVTPPVTNPPPTCTLSAAPSTISSGGTSVLTWTTTNATSFVIDNSVGSVTPVAGGSTTTPAISSDTTYTGTATGPGGTVTCTAPVAISHGGGGGPVCSLTISPGTINSGGHATLTWGGSGISSVFIDQGIGTTTSVSGSTQVGPGTSGTYTYTGTFKATDGQTLICSAPLIVTTGGGGCTSNCGGGGGGPTFPNIVLASLPHAINQPLAYLYLSQIPYTGLDLGTWGTVLYWIALVGWSLAAAYLVLFGLLPFLVRKGREFGTQVGDALNSMPAPAFVGASMAAAPAHSAPVYERAAAEEAPSSRYSAYDGFKSFASAEALSIEDIVKGLARSAPKKQVNVEPVYENVEVIAENVEPIYAAVEPVYENVEPIKAAAPAKPAAKAAPIAAEIPVFIEVLIKGDREACFATLRSTIREGGDAEAFLTQVACALDDSYRARLEGTPVHPEIKSVTASLATPVLEKLVTAFASAVDSSYSVGITGAKLALTRALATLGA